MYRTTGTSSGNMQWRKGEDSFGCRAALFREFAGIKSE